MTLIWCLYLVLRLGLVCTTMLSGLPLKKVHLKRYSYLHAQTLFNTVFHIYYTVGLVYFLVVRYANFDQITQLKIITVYATW